jgi:uridine kinase
MPTAQRLFVGVSGGTCSGKTTLQCGLERRLGEDLAVISFDDMTHGGAALKAAGRTVTDWDEPSLFRWADLHGHLNDLRAGRPTTIDARSRESRRAGIPERLVQPRPIVALIGSLALHDPVLAAGFRVRVFIDLPEAELVRRRLTRPPCEENRQPYISTTLLPAHRRLVTPQRALATHIVDGRLPPDALADTVAAIVETAWHAGRAK